LPEQREKHRIATLSIEEGTFLHLANLPPLHRDPFDRMLISQALRHDLTIITVDAAIEMYNVQLMRQG
jgi:PIN domain nuclease of toxin-antitoxin system